MQQPAASRGRPEGRPFPSPFAKPRGVGLNAPFIIVIAGALAIGVYLALHFGKVLK